MWIAWNPEQAFASEIVFSLGQWFSIFSIDQTWPSPIHAVFTYVQTSLGVDLGVELHWCSLANLNTLNWFMEQWK